MSVYGGPDIITDGLVLHLDAANRKSYPGSGTSWNDLSGNGNHGTATSVSHSFSDGGYFYSGGSTGTSKFAVPSSDLQTAGGKITVEVWLKTIVLADAWIFSLQTGTSSNYTNGWLLRMDNPAYDILWTPPAFKYISGANNNGIILNTWQHIVANNDPDNNMFRFFVNGEIRLTTTPSTIDYTGVRDYAYIGAHDQSGFLGMNARISIARVYNRALSANEVQQNYNALKGRFGL